MPQHICLPLADYSDEIAQELHLFPFYPLRRAACRRQRHRQFFYSIDRNYSTGRACSAIFVIIPCRPRKYNAKYGCGRGAPERKKAGSFAVSCRRGLESYFFLRVQDTSNDGL